MRVCVSVCVCAVVNNGLYIIQVRTQGLAQDVGPWYITQYDVNATELE